MSPSRRMPQRNPAARRLLISRLRIPRAGILRLRSTTRPPNRPPASRPRTRARATGRAADICRRLAISRRPRPPPRRRRRHPRTGPVDRAAPLQVPQVLRPAAAPVVRRASPPPAARPAAPRVARHPVTRPLPRALRLLPDRRPMPPQIQARRPARRPERPIKRVQPLDLFKPWACPLRIRTGIRARRVLAPPERRMRPRQAFQERRLSAPSQGPRLPGTWQVSRHLLLLLRPPAPRRSRRPPRRWKARV